MTDDVFVGIGGGLDAGTDSAATFCLKVRPKTYLTILAEHHN